MGCHAKTIFYVDGVQLKCYLQVGRGFKGISIIGIGKQYRDLMGCVKCFFFGHWFVGGGW